MTRWLKTLRNILYSYVSTACYCTRNLKQCLKFLLIIFGTQTITSSGKCLVRCSDVAASLHRHFWWHVWVKALLNAFSSGKRRGLAEVGCLTGDWERCSARSWWRTRRLQTAGVSFLLLGKVIAWTSTEQICLFFYLQSCWLAAKFLRWPQGSRKVQFLEQDGLVQTQAELRGSCCRGTGVLALNDSARKAGGSITSICSLMERCDVQVLTRLSRSWRISWLGKDETGKITSLIYIAVPSSAVPHEFASYIPDTKKEETRLCLWWRNLVQMRKWCQRRK